jgi:hypothetical protein
MDREDKMSSWKQRWLIGMASLLAFGMLQPASAAAEPYINSAWSDGPVMPTRFSPNDLADFEPEHLGPYNLNNYVRRIQWSSWGGTTAEGNGEVSLLHSDGSTSPVRVVLGGLEDCAGIPVYTSYSLTLPPGAQQPTGWPQGRAGAFPCRPSFANNYGGERLTRKSNCITGLYQLYKKQTIYAKWQPRPPGQFWFLCELKFHRWGKPRALGVGNARLRSHVANGGAVAWPMRIELSQPIWCPKLAGGWTGAITYGKLNVVLKGKKLPATGRTYRQVSAPRLARCENFGYPESELQGNPLRLPLFNDGDAPPR